MHRLVPGGVALLVSLALAFPVPAGAQELPDPMSVPALAAFIGDSDFGSRHPEAPEQLEQWGRLAGVWQTRQELQRQDGGWAESAPGLWIWKYALGGFAVQDLFFQSGDNLPIYMASFGRDYLLTGLRIYDVGAGGWRVAWAANGAGKTPGVDFGTFHATHADGGIVMTDPSAGGQAGLQRVQFVDITDDSFTWLSEFSQDGGETWVTFMRMTAQRIR